MSPEFNKDVILLSRFVHHVSNAKAIFVVGHVLHKVVSALRAEVCVRGLAAVLQCRLA